MSYKKYRNIVTEVDGIKFASAAESRRYSELRLLVRAGAITDLTLQPRYEIIPKYINAKGRKVQAAYYVADFNYYDTTEGEYVIEDVKRPQTATAVYKLKKKLFEYRYPDKTIIEVDA